MPNVIIAPDLAMMQVERRGILTVPSEDAIVSCSCARIHGSPCAGIDVTTLPLAARTLQLYLYEMGERFVDRMRVRGYELQGTLRLHGPWPSYEFNQKLADAQSAAFAEAQRTDDLSLLLPFVADRTAVSPYSDYLLVGNFLKQAVLTEVWIEEKTI